MKTTESNSLYDGLEQMSALELAQGINAEDAKVAAAVASKLSEISSFVEALVERMKDVGRVF